MKISTIVKYLLFRVINTEIRVRVLILLFFFLSFSNLAFPQDAVTTPSRSQALAAWDKSDYSAAYKQFNGLLLLYSRDPLYKYYTGACLVNLQKDIPRAVTLLESAISSSANIKSVPEDVWFWYGRALHLNGNFDQAAEAYDRFTKLAGKRSAQDYETQKYQQLCNSGQGALPRQEQADARSENVTNTVSGKPAGQIQPVQVPQQPEKPAATEQEVDIPAEYETDLAMALNLQHTADSLMQLSIERSREAAAADPAKRQAITGEVEDLRGRALEMQKQADRIFLKLEPGERPEGKVMAEMPPPSSEVMIATEQAQIPEQVTTKADNRVPVYSVFKILSDTEGAATGTVPVDTPAPEGLVYRIQLAAFRNPVDASLFKGLSPLYGRYSAEKGVNYYYAGLFRKLDDARQALPAVKSHGFADAFIIALMDNNQVSMERAGLLEREWSDRPLQMTPGNTQPMVEKSISDTLHAGTLTFRAEVMRSKKPLKPEILEKIELLAGARGLEVIENNQGEKIYLIGNFITFESADDYVSLLIRNGYSEAKVVAYVGVTEIPVEAARQLLYKLINE